jgi:crossover junction endodeoxyribonuclease RusA
MSNATVHLPWFPLELQPNYRGHFYTKSPITKCAKEHAWAQALSSRVYGFNPSAPIALSITFYPPNAYRRDLDNCLSSCKAFLDGIAQAWGVNDAQFRPITIDFGDVVKGGEIRIIATQAGGGK